MRTLRDGQLAPGARPGAPEQRSHVVLRFPGERLAGGVHFQSAARWGC
jgi:hypothetical protein